jgi:hypothetical protein
MGDRAVVAVLSNEFGTDGLVYLFTQWAGKATPLDVQKALKIETLLKEGSHLAGTIFASMTSPSRISTKLPPGGIGNDNAIIVVDVRTQRVGFAHEDEQPSTYKDWSFGEYVDLPAETIDEYYQQGRTVL